VPHSRSKFRNLDPFQARGPLDILRWQVLDTLAGRRRKDRGKPFRTPWVENDGTALAAPEASLTWIGHASFALRIGGLLTVLDPIWRWRLAPTVTRNAPPGVEIEAMPAVDVITISHAHRDHLDLPTCEALVARTIALRGAPPTFLVPTEVGRYVKHLAPVVELGWWEDHRIGDVTYSLVPQQHWSMRVPWDRDTALWGGWVVRGPEGAAYHAGDTAYFSHFGEIGERKGPIDWAMLPIGAYEPQWFMKPQHMGPEEAGRAFVELGAKNLVAMHWGTYKLTDEPLGEPPARLRAWWTNERLPEERLWVMAIGETRRL
jgi:L-ascorbate metabolism protein UlaG (beta-lactamase superfamily)